MILIWLDDSQKVVTLAHEDQLQIAFKNSVGENRIIPLYQIIPDSKNSVAIAEIAGKSTQLPDNSTPADAPAKSSEALASPLYTRWTIYSLTPQETEAIAPLPFSAPKETLESDDSLFSSSDLSSTVEQNPLKLKEVFAKNPKSNEDLVEDSGQSSGVLEKNEIILDNQGETSPSADLLVQDKDLAE